MYIQCNSGSEAQSETLVKISTPQSFFYHISVLDFIKCFFCIYWYDHMAFILRFAYVVYHIYWFVDTVPTLHTQNKSHWSWYDLFNVLLDAVCQYFVEYFIFFLAQMLLSQRGPLWPLWLTTGSFHLSFFLIFFLVIIFNNFYNLYLCIGLLLHFHTRLLYEGQEPDVSYSFSVLWHSSKHIISRY